MASGMSVSIKDRSWSVIPESYHPALDDRSELACRERGEFYADIAAITTVPLINIIICQTCVLYRDLRRLRS